MGDKPLHIKRVYDPPAAGDGLRVLVDRLWPRGLAKARAELDIWAKDVAPSPELRTWWHHDPPRFAEFAARYRAELESNAAVDTLRTAIDASDGATLLFGAHDPEINHAVVLRDFLLGD